MDAPLKNINVIVIDQSSPYLKQVKQLADANNKTLGFFPGGAFDEQAKKQLILVAVGSNMAFLGYLLYRISRQRAIIVHLCVDPSFRKNNIGRYLVNKLKERVKDLKGVGLTCRRDFVEASKVWANLGFTPRYEKPGRSKQGSTLTFWWYDFGHPTLFTNIEKETVTPKAVLDANVFFDLQKESSDALESKALLADWLRDNLIFCVTDELLNEINRKNDPGERKKWRQIAHDFIFIKGRQEKNEKIEEQLKSILGKALNISDESDIRHLAHSISEDAEFFITRDGKLLEHSNEIFQGFGISVVRPLEIIQDIDKLLRAAEYQPTRVGGTPIEFSSIPKGAIPTLIKKFQNYHKGENRSPLVNQIRIFLAQPNFYKAYIIQDNAKEAIGLIVFNRRRDGFLEVPLLRIGAGNLSSTLSRYLVHYAVLASIREKRAVTLISDSFMGDEIFLALEEEGFIKPRDYWIKYNLYSVDSVIGSAKTIESLKVTFPEETDSLSQTAVDLLRLNEEKKSSKLLDAELSLWPAKFSDLDMPCFIVPIKPYWALHLFDENLANQTLFGAAPKLALSIENVYYRSSQPGIIKAPSRVLWYVSDDSEYSGSKSVRACSIIREVLVGKPKELFHQFRHLGVYEWRDVFNTAKNDLNNEIMAFRFSHNELFDFPIGFGNLNEIVEKIEGHSVSLQSPCKISSDCFFLLYNYGIKGNNRQ